MHGAGARHGMACMHAWHQRLLLVAWPCCGRARCLWHAGLPGLHACTQNVHLSMRFITYIYIGIDTCGRWMVRCMGAAPMPPHSMHTCMAGLLEQAEGMPLLTPVPALPGLPVLSTHCRRSATASPASPRTASSRARAARRRRRRRRRPTRASGTTAWWTTCLAACCSRRWRARRAAASRTASTPSSTSRCPSRRARAAAT